MLNQNKCTKIKPKPKPTLSCKNCSYVCVCVYHYVQLLYTTQHRTVLIISPLILRRIIIVPMMSTGGEGSIESAKNLIRLLPRVPRWETPTNTDEFRKESHLNLLSAAVLPYVNLVLSLFNNWLSWCPMTPVLTPTTTTTPVFETSGLVREGLWVLLTERMIWTRVGSNELLPPRHRETSDRCHHRPAATCISSNSSWHTRPEADLGLFSMFSRTGAPTKRGPQKRTGKFLQHSNMPEIIEIIIRKRFCVARWHLSFKSFLCAYNYVMRVLNKMSMRTTLSLCMSCEFSREVFVY